MCGTYPYEWRDGQRQSLGALLVVREAYRSAGRRVVSTNGCFDLLHAGHARFLAQARALGDLLLVGVNSDSSVCCLKGPGHPYVPEEDRAALLAALRPVDHVVVFDDLLPSDLLAILRPDVHCKAADYSIEALPEAQVVQLHGGEVRILPLAASYSTSRLVGSVVAAVTGECSGEPGSVWATDARSHVIKGMLSGSNVLRQIAYRASDSVVLAAAVIADAVSSGGEILLYSDGTGCLDTSRLAHELAGAMRSDRQSVSIVSLASDALEPPRGGNSPEFDQADAEQVADVGQAGDVLLAMSTSPDLPVMPFALGVLRDRGLRTVALTGGSPSHPVEGIDVFLAGPTKESFLTAQGHMSILHALCDLVSRMLNQRSGGAYPGPEAAYGLSDAE